MDDSPTARCKTGCRAKAARRGLCWGCIKRLQRGLPLDQPRRAYHYWGDLFEAALAYADASADDDGEFRRRRRALLVMARRTVLGDEAMSTPEPSK